MKERCERRKTVRMIKDCVVRGDIITSLEIAVVDGMTIEQYTVLYLQILQYMRKEDEGK